MIYIIFFLLLSLASLIYYKYAQKAKILDNPNQRSSHTTPTIRGGGIVFFAAVLLFFIYKFSSSQTIPNPYFLSGFLLLSILGFIDDKKELSATIRFPFQLIAVALILFDAGLFTSNLPIWLQITGFIIAVGFVNAFNFMDGINGITGFYTLAIILPVLYLNHTYPVFDNNFFYVIIIAILVFGFYNFRKNALMFAGDIGSMSLAAVILFWLTKMMIAIHSPLLLALVVVYGVDSALTILNRLRHKENIFEAHRWHLYQKFGDIWAWSHLKTALVYMSLQLIISFLIINFLKPDIYFQIIILIGVYLMVSLLYFFIYRNFTKIKSDY